MININRFYKYIKKRAISAAVVIIALSCPLMVEASENKLNSFVTTSNLNLRSEASTESEIERVFPEGTEVEIIEYISIDWFKVTADGMTGYMSAEFLATHEQYEQMKEQSSAEVESSPGDVELVPWHEATGLFTPGVPAQVLDVRTGLTYMVKSFSNGNHADVEPITKEDTSTMLQTYGGAWSWNCRPIIVTINGHSMAASISGMPHGGGVNSSNGMDGQVCIHFSGSTTHNGNTSHERDHQAAVLEAFNSGY